MSKDIRPRTVLVYDYNTGRTADLFASSFNAKLSPNDVFNRKIPHNNYLFSIYFKRNLFIDELYSNFDIIIIMYSMNSIIDDDTYFKRNVIRWYNEYYSQNEDSMIIFVCDKTGLDLYNENIKHNEGETLCRQYGFNYYEITKYNKEFIFYEIRKYILQEYYKKLYPISWAKSKEGNDCNEFGNTLYDMITILISFADLGTDLWVLYGYYVKGRKTFFVIGLIIIIMAQLTYCIVFLVKFSNYHWTVGERICRFFILLPVSWLLGVAFYLSTFDDSWFVKVVMEDWLDCDVYIENYENESRSKAWKWFWEKLEKHVGFILESVCEAFPKLIYYICVYIRF